jgi:hypothetical protein
VFCPLLSGSKVAKSRRIPSSHFLGVWVSSSHLPEVGLRHWQFDSRPLKVGNWPNFLTCRWHATYNWKDFDEGYNFVLNLISIEGLHIKLWGPKVTGIPTLGISRQNAILDVGLMERHKVYYKGEGGGFPQVQAMVSLMNPNCPWLILAPKVLQLCINHLVLVLCRSVWVVDACHSP